MRLSLVILTLNEIDGLRRVFDLIPLDSVDEILAIDGGSTDGTVEFLASRSVPAHLQKSRGRGNAFLDGMALAQGDIIVFFSPDGNEDPRDISKLVAKMKEGCDMVIASRFGKGGGSVDVTPTRKLLNILCVFVLRALWGTNISDAVNGFRAIRRRRMLELELDAQRFDIEWQMTIRAVRRGFSVAEVPTFESRRVGGKSGLPLFSTGLLFARVLVRELFRM